ncbi:MAG TPA: hypothetical protein VMW27_18235 [Thermoanaerobaculia bacterium]|nr:hypothetical protein [Thermoanaerobaculia bacterium]
MKVNEESLQKVRVARPCPASWSDMVGDERMRFCSLCRRNVYNLSALTSTEALDLLQSQEGEICGLLYRRADGTVITADCPVGQRMFLARLGRRVAALAAGILLAFGGRFLTPQVKQRFQNLEKATSVGKPRAAAPMLAPEEIEKLRLLGALGYVE